MDTLEFDGLIRRYPNSRNVLELIYLAPEGGRMVI